MTHQAQRMHTGKVLTAAPKFVRQVTGGNPRPRRLSDVFRELSDTPDDHITIGQICARLGDRGFAALLLMFSVINLIPVPPGVTLVLSLPLVLLSAQMVFGLKAPWLPAKVTDRSISKERFRSACSRLVPRLVWLESTVRPRYWPFPVQTGERLVGVIALILAIAVFLPIPFGNWLPAAALTLVSLSLTERDGIFLALGVVLGIISLIIIAMVLGTAGAVAAAIFGYAGAG